jgi:hypothetical protein
VGIVFDDGEQRQAAGPCAPAARPGEGGAPAGHGGLKALADREAEYVTFKDEREDAVLTVASKRRQLAETSTQAADSANARLS